MPNGSSSPDAALRPRLRLGASAPDAATKPDVAGVVVEPRAPCLCDGDLRWCAGDGEPTQPEGEPDALHRIAVSVTSPSAARDVCHQVVAFLAHSKKDRVIVEWQGVDGQAHSGRVTGESARDAEIVAVRVSAAAKAHLDSEKTS